MYITVSEICTLSSDVFTEHTPRSVPVKNQVFVTPLKIAAVPHVYKATEENEENQRIKNSFILELNSNLCSPVSCSSPIKHCSRQKAATVNWSILNQKPYLCGLYNIYADASHMAGQQGA